MDIEKKKKKLLDELTPKNGKLKYKRYSKNTLRYAGGKTLAVGYIVELLPNNIDKIISPFIGGGSVEVAIANELDLEVEAYDIFEILVNYWQIQLKQPKKLYEKLKEIPPTREQFYDVKKELKKHWDKEIVLDNLDLATKYFYNFMTSYGPHFLGSPSSVYLQDKNYNRIIEKVKNFKCPNLNVKIGDFEEVIKNNPNTFLYCDPPYYLEGDSKTFVGLYPHRNFPIHHKGFKHESLANLLKNHKGGFILSYNDCTAIRELYKDFEFSTPKWQYTFSQGDTRIGENRLKDNNGSHIKQSHELLIWKMPEN